MANTKKVTQADKWSFEEDNYSWYESQMEKYSIEKKSKLLKEKAINNG